MVLKEGIFNSFYLGRVWWSWKNHFLTVFYIWEDVVFLKKSFITVSTFSGCGGLGITDFYSFHFGGCGGLKGRHF